MVGLTISKVTKNTNPLDDNLADNEEAEEEPLENNFSDHAPILLYHSLMNEIEKENAQVKANIKLMVSKDLKEDILRKDFLINGEFVKSKK